MRTILSISLFCAHLGAAVTVYRVQATGGDFTAANIQTQITNNGACGQVYDFKAGETFDLSSSGLLLPKITSGLNSFGLCTHPPMLRSSECGGITARNGGTTDAAKMATLSSSNITGTLRYAVGAHSWVVKCLDIYNSADTLSTVLMAGQDINGSYADNDLKGLIRHSVFSKNWVHGNTTFVGNFRVNNGIQGITNNVRFEGNRIEDCGSGAYDSNAEGHGFSVSTSYNILFFRNNGVHCGSIKWIVGGAFSAVAGATGQVRADGNYFQTPYYTRYRQSTSNPTGSCLYNTTTDAETWYNTAMDEWWRCGIGGTWPAMPQGSGDSPFNNVPKKNLFEIKIADGAYVAGNIGKTCPYPTFGQQNCAFILNNQSDSRYTTKNPEGGMSWTLFDANVGVDTASGFIMGSLAGSPPSPYTASQDNNDFISHTHVKNLVLRNMGWSTLLEVSPSLADVRGIQWTRMKGMFIEHATIVNNVGAGAGVPHVPYSSDGVSYYANIWNWKLTGAYCSGFYWTAWVACGNAQYAQWGQDVIIGDSGSEFGHLQSQNQFDADIYGGGALNYQTGRRMCQSCFYPADAATVAFVDHSADGSTALTGEALDVTSPYKGKAGGKDPGADIPYVAAMTSCAVSGCKNPMLDFRSSIREALTTSATLHYFAPSRSAGAVTVSVNASYSSPAFTSAGSVGVRSRDLPLTGLTANTHYFYKVVSDGLTIDGEFVTR